MESRKEDARGKDIGGGMESRKDAGGGMMSERMQE